MVNYLQVTELVRIYLKINRESMNAGYALLSVALASFLLIVLPMIVNAFYNHPEWWDRRKFEREEEVRRLIMQEHLDLEEAFKRAREKYPEKHSEAFILHVKRTALVTVLWTGLLWLGIVMARR